MTREEAIKELQESHDMMRSYDIDESESRLMTALNMAIQALSQEPCDDKRLFIKIYADDDIIDNLCENSLDLGALESWGREQVMNIPPVTHKSGKWIDLHRCWICSECSQETHIEHNFCPNCGAKMESEE